MSDSNPIIILILSALAVLIVCGYGLANCFGPCSWVSWEPVSEMPGRCLPGMPK